MARGFEEKKIFIDDEDRSAFVEMLGDTCARTGWRVHAWVLLDNHYHFLVQTPEANLVWGMKSLQNFYTRRFTTRHPGRRKVFGDRYKSVHVEGGDPWYYMTALDYIHLNPVRSGLVKPKRGESIVDYPWSSVASGYALPSKGRPSWLAAADGLEVYGLSDSASGRREFVDLLDERGRDEPQRSCGVAEGPADGRVSHLRQGWYWGSIEFSQKVRGILAGDVKVRAKRTDKMAANRHDENEADRLVREGLKRCQLAAKDLAGLPGTDPRKLEIAVEVRTKTAVSDAWIADRLKMRSAANVSQQLRLLRR
jgi:REP element-mobilizing transposase RayT